MPSLDISPRVSARVAERQHTLPIRRGDWREEAARKTSVLSSAVGSTFEYQIGNLSAVCLSSAPNADGPVEAANVRARGGRSGRRWETSEYSGSLAASAAALRSIGARFDKPLHAGFGAIERRN